MSTSVGSAMPVFSYAQAAKGLAPSKEEAPEQVSSKPSHTGSVTPEGPSRSSRSKQRQEEKEIVETTTATTDGTTESVTLPEVLEKVVATPSQHSQQPSESERRSVSATSPDLTAQTASPKGSDFSPRVNGRADSWEKGSEASTSVDQATQTGDKEKLKDSEDDWEKVSVPSILAEKELKAAPLPIVNIWQQRREAQQAKQRELATQKPIIPPSPIPQPKQPMEEPKRKQTSKDGSEKESPPATRRSHDRKEAAAPSTSRPTSQNSDKIEAANLPSVADTKSWPTPETAIVDERRKSTTYEKAEKPEIKGNSNKGHGNKWVHVPFVPTAKFETPLPPAAAIRRGGRAGPRGRDGPGKAGHTNAGEKHEGQGSMGPPPLPKQPSENDRGRRPEGARGGRASSVPAGGRVPSSSDSSTAISRKPSAPVNKEQSIAEGLSSISAVVHDNGSSDQASAGRATSQASSKHDGSGAAIAVNGEIPVSQAGQEISAELQHGATSDIGTRPSYQSERSKTSNPSFSRANGDSVRERGSGRNREWSREKSDAAREKVESWRDRETAGESNTRREPRPDRGRGGTYRGGRGNHPYSAFSASHAYTSPLPQNGFENSKPNVSNEPRSRQPSQPYIAPSQSSSNRPNPRSQSIAVGMMYQGYFNPQGMSQAISPLATDMSGFGYPQQMPMQPGIMSAMPYHDPLNSYALLSMVMTQVEYYFSIDNLCKDLFLRRHMDSQGFVPLSVIADFKRIKTLTDNNGTLDALRWVCPQLKTIEYVRTADNEEKLRRREGWQDFVLPMEERDPSAKHDGPSILPHHSQRAHSMQYFPTETTPIFKSQVRSPPADMSMGNSMFPATSPSGFGLLASADGQSEERPFFLPPVVMQGQARRESMTSPTSQDMAAGRSSSHGHNYRSTSGMVNGHHGHHRQSSRGMLDENVFPDEQIPNINIFMRDSSRDVGGDSAPAIPGISRVFSNESTNSRGSRQDGPRVSGLRGGAASPEQLARLQGMTFGTSESQPPPSSEPPVFFTKDGQQTQMPPLQPGHFYHTYQSLHDTAMQQREHGVDGALEPMFMFWTNFLVDKFNAGMYKEFKSLTTDNTKGQNDVSIQHLMNYYQNVLRSGLAMPEIVANDFVELLRQEKDENKTIFKMLRMAWRDGALNLKTRKRIGDLLTEDEKLRFDKGG